MNQAEEFFIDLKEWSTRKLAIIEKYIKGFSIILGSKSKIIYYIDGFAGRGQYEGGGKGSPVLAAEISEKFINNNKNFTLHCLNVENDHENFKDLCVETDRFGKLVNNYEGSFEENIDVILEKIKHHPAIFFIDDFGVKGTGWNSVEKVIARKNPTDIWIRFDHKTVQRLIGFYNSDAKEASGKINTLQNLFCINDRDELRARLSTGENPEERMQCAVNLYIECLEKTFNNHDKEGFAASYPIISIDGQNKYHLVFACSHNKAATLASNIVNIVEETYQHEKEKYRESKSGQMSLFTELTEKQIFYNKVNDLKKSILNMQKNKHRTREELHYELMCQDKAWFGKIRGKHLTPAIRELLNENPPRIKCIGTPGNDKSIIIIE